MKHAQPEMIQTAQDQQAFWADLAEHFKDTPLYEGFQELGAEKVALWETLEQLAS